MAASNSTLAEEAKQKQMVTLLSSDGEAFDVEATVAVQSQMLKNMIEDGFTGGGIPIPVVTGAVLSKVLNYCKKHAEQPLTGGVQDKAIEQDLNTWDKAFVKAERAVLVDLVNAANFLDIKGLLSLGCQAVAGMISGCNVDEMRRILGVVNDYTPEEEEQIRRENAWAFH